VRQSSSGTATCWCRPAFHGFRCPRCLAGIHHVSDRAPEIAALPEVRIVAVIGLKSHPDCFLYVVREVEPEMIRNFVNRRIGRSETPSTTSLVALPALR